MVFTWNYDEKYHLWFGYSSSKKCHATVGEINGQWYFQYFDNKKLVFDAYTKSKEKAIELVEYLYKRGGEAAVDFLNSAVQADEAAIRMLLFHRVPCNKNLINHSKIVCTLDDKIGLLGILNGIFRDNGKVIRVIYDDDTQKILYFDIINHEEAAKP